MPWSVYGTRMIGYVGTHWGRWPGRFEVWDLVSMEVLSAPEVMRVPALRLYVYFILS